MPSNRQIPRFTLKTNSLRIRRKLQNAGKTVSRHPSPHQETGTHEPFLLRLLSVGLLHEQHDPGDIGRIVVSALVADPERTLVFVDVRADPVEDHQQTLDSACQGYPEAESTHPILVMTA